MAFILDCLVSRVEMASERSGFNNGCGQNATQQRQDHISAPKSTVFLYRCRDASIKTINNSQDNTSPLEPSNPTIPHETFSKTDHSNKASLDRPCILSDHHG